MISIEIEKVNQGYEDLLAQVDLAFVSKDASIANGAQNLHEALEVLGPKLKRPHSRLICTWGDQGASGMDEKGQKYFVKAEKVEKIVDSCGAGDTFTATVIGSLVKGAKFESAIEFACKMAAKKISQVGFRDLFD